MGDGFFRAYIPVNVAVLPVCQEFHQRRSPAAAAEYAKLERCIKKILFGHNRLSI
jgi:hypothetical protein